MCLCRRRKRHQECTYTEKDHMRTQWKGSHLQAKEKSIRRNYTCQYLDHGLPSSKIVRSQFLLFTPPRHFVMSALQTNTLSKTKKKEKTKKDHHHQHRWIWIILCWIKDVESKRVYPVWFNLCEILEKGKLILGGKHQNNGYLRGKQFWRGHSTFLYFFVC